MIKGTYIIQDREQSAVSEAYRVLRGNLQNQQARKILFVSAQKGNSNALTALNTAASLAYAGKKVILVDCDLRTPFLSDMVNIRQIGLSEVVSGDRTLEEALQPTGIENVSILAPGRLPIDPFTILGHSGLRDIFGELEKMADYVLVSSSPLVMGSREITSDACALASKIDKIVFVLDSRVVRVKAAKKVQALLQRANAVFLGVVLRDLPQGEFS